MKQHEYEPGHIPGDPNFTLTPLVVTGEVATGTVRVDGRKLSPRRSQQWRNHSPDGFAWGYGGSGPAQLALALLLEIFNPRRRRDQNWLPYPFDYQQFKWDYIAKLDVDRDFELRLNPEHIRRRYARDAA